MYKLTVVILTYNEGIHIARAINNVKEITEKIIVLDSYSQDKTVEIAQSLGAEILFRQFDDYKNQRQYAIDYCKPLTEWMLFLDADEYLMDALKQEIKNIVSKPQEVSGYYLCRRAIFMNRWIRHGDCYPTYLLRLFKPQVAIVSEIINEHVSVIGKIGKLHHDFVDQNLKTLVEWTDKHNRYTTLEAKRLFFDKTQKTKKFNLCVQAERKKWIRENCWNRLPVLLRPFLYFFYRYVVRMGFLDGKAGFIYHALQGWWLWFLVGAKFLEMEKRTRDSEKFGNGL